MTRPSAADALREAFRTDQLARKLDEARRIADEQIEAGIPAPGTPERKVNPAQGQAVPVYSGRTWNGVSLNGPIAEAVANMLRNGGHDATANDSRVWGR